MSEEAEFREKASSRVVARLLASLVNESFFKGHLINSTSLPEPLRAVSTSKFWICITSGTTDDSKLEQLLHTKGTFWSPLHGLPAIQRHSSTSCFTVTLLDLEDIASPILQKNEAGSYVPVDSRTVMQQLKEWHPNLNPATVEQLTLELENCIAFQEAAYHHHHRRALPALSSSEAVEWEQIIVEGHPIHPMYKARFAVPPTLPVDPRSNKLLNPDIHFFAVPRLEVTVKGEFDKLLAPFVETSAVDNDVDIVIPVHQLQVPNILHYFPAARQLPFTRTSKAQASMRTVVVRELPEFNLKLALGVKIGSAMRTITPCTAHNGPAFRAISDILVEDKQLLELAHEVATVASNHPDESIAKHLSCVIRQNPESLAAQRGEKVVICSALKERCSSTSDEYVINAVLNLNTGEKKEEFFRKYSSMFLRAFVPPLFKHGVCFEAHLQNVLARFKPLQVDGDSSWELVGFTVRDFGGIKVHQPSLRSSTGLQLDVLDEKESSKLAHTVDEVHQLAYHVMIQGHLQPIARALDVHYGGKGWEFVRQQLDEILLPPDCRTRQLWLESETTFWKAFIHMKFQDLYRDYVYTTVPNLIVYRQPDSI